MDWNLKWILILIVIANADTRNDSRTTTSTTTRPSGTTWNIKSKIINNYPLNLL